MTNTAASSASTKIFSKTIIVALFAAFICAGSFIHIPLPGGVPVAIQDMMAMLAGLLLGSFYGGLSVLLFLLLGCVGLPVFTGKAGLHVIIAGPTGGFLIGYLAGAIAGGLVLKFFWKDAVVETGDVNLKKTTMIRNIVVVTVAAVAATLVVFVIGIFGFMRIVDGGIQKALALAIIPFIPGNILKIVVMVPLTLRLRPIIKNYL